jgi:hypothetical protein
MTGSQMVFYFSTLMSCRIQVITKKKISQNRNDIWTGFFICGSGAGPNLSLDPSSCFGVGFRAATITGSSFHCPGKPGKKPEAVN